MIIRALRWLAHEAWEKVNIVETWRELRELGRRHGRRFFIVAVAWELIEDVLFPYLSYRAGHPELIPVFLVLHFEPVVYPVFFFVFRTWDRILGREPWEPDRLGQSTFWRTGLVVLSYRLPALVAFFGLLTGLGLPLSILAVYTVAMSIFGMVHDRLWHDSNFGINVESDTVRPSRIVVKALTYRAISAFVMAGVFQGFVGHVPPPVWMYQVLMLGLHIGINALWAHSAVGIRPTSEVQVAPPTA